MLAAIRERQPAVTFLAYPNNPTGNLFAADCMRAVLAAADGLVVVDEAYAPFTDASFMSSLDEFDNLAQSTRLLRGALQGVRSAASVVANPGQGHRAVIAALAGYAPAAIVGRDLLALAATQRCLAGNRHHGRRRRLWR